MKKVKVTMYFEVEENALEEIKKLEHHAEYLLNLEEYPEIKSVYGAKVEEEKELTENVIFKSGYSTEKNGVF